MVSRASSSTAQYVAAMRTMLTEDGVLDDPYAAAMLGRSMRRIVRLLGLPGMRWTRRSVFFAGIATRVAWFDDEVRRATAAGIDQVVVVGAGFDSRAWRIGGDGVRWFEVDHPLTQATKRACAPAGGPTYVPCDLASESVGDALDGAGFDRTAASVLVLEGLVMYLDEPQVVALLAGLLPSVARGSALLVNFQAPRGTGGLGDRVRAPLLQVVGTAHGESHRSRADGPTARRLVEAGGWVVDEVVALRDVAPALLPGATLPLDGINPDAVAVRAAPPAS